MEQGKRYERFDPQMPQGIIGKPQRELSAPSGIEEILGEINAATKKDAANGDYDSVLGEIDEVVMKSNISQEYRQKGGQ